MISLLLLLKNIIQEIFGNKHKLLTGLFELALSKGMLYENAVGLKGVF